MQLTTKYYYDDETLEKVASRFFVDGEEVSFEYYADVINSIAEENEKNNETECDCCCDECEDCENVCDEVFNEEVELVCDDNCGECGIPDDICEEIHLINEVAENIENGEMCPVCLRNLLLELYVKGKNVGWSDHRDYIREINED